MEKVHDLVVIGGGPGGYVAALRAAEAGRNVLLVDRAGVDGVGGVCLRTGCIPSKALIEAADLAHRAGTSKLGLVVERSHFDMDAFQSTRRSMIERLTGGVRALAAASGKRAIGARAMHPVALIPPAAWPVAEPSASPWGPWLEEGAGPPALPSVPPELARGSCFPGGFSKPIARAAGGLHRP